VFLLDLGDISYISREILSARKTKVLFKESEAWMELTEADGIKVVYGEKVERAMTAVLRGVKMRMLFRYIR
jgi:hypothetical protein